MKKFYCYLMVVAVCVLYLAGDVFALKNSQVNKYISAINELNEKYGVTVSVRVIDPEKANQLSDNEINQKLHTLEEKLIIGQKALEENNKQESMVQQKSGSAFTAGRQDSTRANAHTVYYYKDIGYIYPSGSTIRCTLRANRVYSDLHARYIWGTIISNSSSLFSGAANDWNETNTSTSLVDGDRTYYAQYWGDLTEVYNDGVYEHEITSYNWRIWFEAYCPAT